MTLPDADIAHSDNLGRPQRLVVNGLNVTQRCVLLTQLPQLRVRHVQLNVQKITEKKIGLPFD